MKTHSDFAMALLEADGSCRDVNFQAASWTGLAALLNKLELSYGSSSGTDQSGESLKTPLPRAVLAAAQSGGSAHLVYAQGSELIRNLQVFVCSNNDQSPFVELTFFPDDLDRNADLLRDLIVWLNSIQELLEASRYFVRYENASWRFGDTGPLSGVIFVSDEICHGFQ